MKRKTTTINEKYQTKIISHNCHRVNVSGNWTPLHHLNTAHGPPLIYSYSASEDFCLTGAI